MRIQRLDLTRYGVFTDHSMVFKAPPPGEPDLHIVYGPNEAGKSTTFAAILDLLFGIELRSRYGFLHPYPTMRIGALLEIGGREQEFVRLKRQQNSLLDGAGQAVAENLIQSELGGLDRAAYTTMFSLDDDTLEAGGESILASQGDLGQLLFSASTGLPDLHRKLAALRAQAETYYKYRGRGGLLADLKARLLDLRKQGRAMDTVAPEYARLLERYGALEAQYKETLHRRSRLETELDVLRKREQALPKLASLRRLREQIAPWASIPDVPDTLSDGLSALQAGEIELSTHMRALDAEIDAISAELEDITVDDEVLSRADRIERLGTLSARRLTAEEDLPERRQRLDRVRGLIAGLLERLGCPAQTRPDSLLLDASKTGRLRELIEEHPGILAALRSAREELSTADHALQEAVDRLNDVMGGSPPPDAATLAKMAAVVSHARADDHAARQRLAGRARKEHAAQLEEGVARLRPWAGQPARLRDLDMPEADEIAKYSSAMEDLETRIGNQAKEVERLEGEKRAFQQELGIARQTTGVVNDAEAARARAERERAWAEHRHVLDAESAAGFEKALRHDDLVSAGRIAHASEVARLNHISANLARTQAALDVARVTRRELRAQLQLVQADLAARIRAMGAALPEDWSPSRLGSWLAYREDALHVLAGLERAQREEAHAREDGDALFRLLQETARLAKIEYEPGAGPDTVLALLQAALDRESRAAGLRDRVAEQRRDFLRRKRRMQESSQAWEDWQGRWERACSTCWFGREGTTPEISAVRDILKVLDDLAPLLDELADLEAALEKMEADRARFAHEVEMLAREMDPADDRAGTPPAAAAARLMKSLEEARSQQQARRNAQERLSAAQSRRQSLGEALAIHVQHKKRLLGLFQVRTLDEAAQSRLSLHRRRMLEEQAHALEDELRALAGLTDMAGIEAVLDSTDAGALVAEIARLGAESEHLDDRSRELFSERAKLGDQLEAVGGDDAVARLAEQAQTLVLQIEEGAREHLRLNLGIAAAEQALRLYRDRHRSAMMERASAAFRTLSRGAYEGLTTQADRDTEVLLALSAREGSKLAADLSKGTRFQLYLAFRVAGYLEFAATRPAVPFIADDIMETFDDFRAEEALRLFADMACVGQVIYLTHHRHLCAIAREVCPGVQIHELRNPLRETITQD